MMTREFQYQLAKHGKWICPQCHHRTYVVYLDADGQILDEECGKCDRADHCGFHYPPRQFFADHQSVAEATGQRYHKPRFIQEPAPSFMDGEVLKQSCIASKSHHNNLVTFLGSVFDAETVQRMVNDYFIGTARHWPGATVFWMVDVHGRVRGGKIMLFNATDGKRVKKPHNHITWVHTVMKLPDYHLRQCLFGSHLLVDNPDKAVAVFESEKSAVIASGVLGDCIAVSCGGCGGLSFAMCEPLLGRDVLLFPDQGKHNEWREKGSQLRYLFKRLRIANIMEREAENPGDDFADLVVRCYPVWRQTSTGNVSLDLGLEDL